MWEKIVAFKRNLAYEASAGSGKTFMLVVRYLSLLFMGADASKILALTFTNKAAAEMNARIIETLESLATRDELKEIAKLCETTKEEILQRREAILEEFLRANTKIMTIDSFFTQILRKFSLYVSLMPDFTTFASQHEVKLLSRFLKEVSVAGKKDMLVALALESKKRFGDIFTLLEEFYEKEHELQKVSFKSGNLQMHQKGAMDAFFELKRIVESSKDASATAKKSVDITTFDELLKKSWIDKDSLNYRTFSKCYTPLMDILLQDIQEHIKNYFRVKEENFFSALFELLELYKKAKRALYQEESELGFNDVTQLVYTILHHLDDSEFLYFRLDATIEHMLLDEFQDTSVIQYKILEPLISEITSGNGIFENGSFFFVGDTKQSIYRFRGGVSALFYTVAEQHSTQIEKLRVNYRSKKSIVDFVNEVFQNKIKGYTPQLSRDGSEGGYVAIKEDIDPLKQTLEIVKELLEAGADVNRIAILCATNGDGEMVKNMLQQEGIEVVTETTTKLINQRSVEALLEYLKYLYFKEDIYRYNFFALINHKIETIPFIDLKEIALQEILRRAINRYGLFSDDFHVVRFLYVVSSFSDIEALLFEYERIEVSAAASDVSGVRVLTVHKSKGLEYEHVVVMDRLSRAPAPRNTIIYEYEGIELQNIYLRSAKREALDRHYALALQKEQALVYEDRLNALYVAFTRAREQLFIVQKPKDSAFDILELPQTEYGTFHVNTKMVEKSFIREPFDFEELYYGTQSELLALQKEKEEDLAAINFGIAMHYMLEMLEAFEPSALHHAFEMMQNRYGSLLLTETLLEIKRRVSNLLEREEFLALLDGKCYKEKAMRYKENLRYIDLLVACSDGSYNIIDYKSSYKDYEQHYKQVQMYCHAVKEITGEKKVYGYLCYLLEDEIKVVRV
jgi:exodeoxyribonuclease V beta subunit